MRKVLLPLLAVAGFAFASWTAFSAPQQVTAPPPVEPPRAPFPSTVSGAGIVEPAAERTTAIGTPFAGMVLEVFHGPGETVTKGTPLFRLDDRPLRARVPVLQAARDATQARLERLLALPRPEDIPPGEARVASARTGVADRRAHLARLERAAAANAGAVTADQVERARFAVEDAERALGVAEADLARLREPAWAPDVAEARAAVAEADAALREYEDLIGRATVVAPADGTILDLDVHAGEFAAAGRDALILFGDLSSLRVRVDVDEESAPLVPDRPKAVALVRGFPDRPIPLEYVRTEPWVRPKRSLTGATNERVDTRVLQVVFRVAETDLPVRVGQQVDVYMEGLARDRVWRPAEEAK